MKVRAITHLQEDYQISEKFWKYQGEKYKSIPLSKYLNCVGVLRGEWFSLSNPRKLESICYGTAIALSKRVILTCAHSLYLEKKRRKCDSVSFILNQQQGIMKKSQIVYKSADANFIRLKQLASWQTFQEKAIPEDLALVYLSEDLPLNEFPDIGLDVSLNSKHLSINDPLFLSGYPSSQYFNNPNLESIKYSRINLNGTLKDMKVNTSTLYHNLNTKTGHSGSAIFAWNSQTQKPTIIGIHTHKGRYHNTGILLTEELLKRLASYDLSFALNHPQYDASVKLPLHIRTSAFEELPKQNRNLISQKSFNYKFYEQTDSDYSDDDEHSEMDDSIFQVECSQQNLKIDQELLHENTSIKINSSKLPVYFSIQEFEEQNYQEINNFSGFQQTFSKTKKSKDITFVSEKKEDLDKTNYSICEQSSQQTTNIEQIFQYLKRIFPQKEQRKQLNYKELSSQIQSNNILEAWEQPNSSIYLENKHNAYCLQKEGLQLPFQRKLQPIRFQRENE